MVVKLPQGHRAGQCLSLQLAGPCLDCLTIPVGHQVIAQMVLYRGQYCWRFTQNSHCLLLLLSWSCPWPWIFLGTRDELTCKSKLQMTNTCSGQSLSKSSFLPHCFQVICICCSLSGSKRLRWDSSPAFAPHPWRSIGSVSWNVRPLPIP